MYFGVIYRMIVLIRLPFDVQLFIKHILMKLCIFVVGTYLKVYQFEEIRFVSVNYSE